MTRLFCALAALFAVAIGCSAAMAQGESRFTGLKLSGDQPIQIESDKLEVRDADGLAIFTGNVNVMQGETLLKSTRMKVFYAKSGDGNEQAAPGDSMQSIERIEVDGKVYVKTQTQVATSDQAAFDMATDTLTMSGKEVVLSDGPNVIVGCKLTVLMSTGEATLDGCGKKEGSGRVKMLLQPSSRSQ
ncbi:LptA/OstA family protein [Aquibium oceanicum]|uniref:LPS ABC transporter substrate-binding protein LptA n=1 Tax=Aquibium oceanicum TaxID=1670800 RepID=A0A1L3SLV8_9HYPH|nr:LptA/OstA family protein [Aquibium oceanicum]APH70341.1 LPS ABC transporter substrate-binding protein LptA [Aquibium oceanicum]